jgi:hypothetical protein
MTISQREAHRLQKRVKELELHLEHQRNRFSSEWPGGVHLGNVIWNGADHIPSAVYTARALGHAVVLVSVSKTEFSLRAVPLGKPI